MIRISYTIEKKTRIVPYQKERVQNRRNIVKKKIEAGTVQDLLAFCALTAPRGSEVQL